MATYTELSCLNDILIKRMKALEEENKVLKQQNKFMKRRVDYNEWDCFRCAECDMVRKDEEGAPLKDFNNDAHYYCFDCINDVGSWECKNCDYSYFGKTLCIDGSCVICCRSVNKYKFRHYVRYDIHKLRILTIEEKYAKVMYELLLKTDTFQPYSDSDSDSDNDSFFSDSDSDSF